MERRTKKRCLRGTLHISGRIASTVAPEILQSETNRAKEKSADALNAWDHYLLARAGHNEMTQASIGRAMSHLDKSVELDPEFADSHALMGLCLAKAAGRGWEQPAREAYLRAHLATEKAVRMAGVGGAVVLISLGLLPGRLHPP